MATAQLTTVETIADELSKHDASHKLQDWGHEMYCLGCDWNNFALGGHPIEYYDDEAKAYAAYDQHLAEAIAHRLWGTK